MLLDKIFGDGGEWVKVQYLDDRPDYYVVRVPTGTHQLIEDRSDEWYEGLWQEITEAIADEAKDFYNEHNWREHEKNGYVYKTRKWPIPPYEPSGSSWSAFEPSIETLAECLTKQ